MFISAIYGLEIVSIEDHDQIPDRWHKTESGYERTWIPKAWINTQLARPDVVVLLITPGSVTMPSIATIDCLGFDDARKSGNGRYIIE